MSDSSPKHSISNSSGETLPLSGEAERQKDTSQHRVQLTNFPITTRDLLREDEMHEVLQLSSSQISQATACNASALVQLSNAEKSHERLQQLLPLYFYSWNLTDSHSVIVFLLLHYFLLKREHKEALGAKGLYEEHIALLKNRMSDLEAKLFSSHSNSKTWSGSGSKNGNENVTDSSSLSEIESLRSRLESMKCENEQLKRTNDELCRINEQWALDYQSLSEQVKNATGFYSVQSGCSSAHSSARASPIPPGMYNQACLHCAQMELQLEAKQDEIRAKERQMDDLRSDLKKMEIKLESKDKDVERLNSEHHAILLQLQEIGDLQAAVKMKHDYRKLQFQLSQTNKQYQEAVSEKLQLQKQVEKLRHVFFGIFPFSNSAPQNVVHSTSDGYSSFPMRTCRRQHHNQYPFSDPTPPTPPGLIARGDHHGSLVEKDEHSLSAHNTLDEQTQTRSLRPISSHDGHVTTVTVKPHDFPRPTYHNNSSSVSESHGSHTTNKHHQPLILENGQPSTFTPSPSSFTRPSSAASGGMYDSSSSRLHLTTSDYSSASSKSLPPFINNQAMLPSSSISSSSQQTSFTSYSSAHTSSTGISSGSNAVTMHHAPPPVPAHSSLVAYPYYPNKSLSVGKDSMPRPSSLSLGKSGGQGSTTMALHLKMSNQQKFECPSCRKQFPYGPREFDKWFEHIRYCENKPQ